MKIAKTEEIKEEIKTKIFDFNGTVALEASVTLPQFGPSNHRLERYYRALEKHLWKLINGKIATAAKNNLARAAAAGTSFRTYHVAVHFTETRNEHGLYACYYDFVYRAGGSVTVLRTADNWSQGCQIPLRHWFAPRAKAGKLVVRAARVLAAQQPELYFPHVRQLLHRHFDEKRYYWQGDDTLVIFYQPGSVAPFSRGVVTFAIPAASLPLVGGDGKAETGKTLQGKVIAGRIEAYNE